MNTSTLLDNNQKEVYKKMSESSMLSNKEYCERFFEWNTYFRRNMHRFIQMYFCISLHLYQIIIIYLMNIFPSFAIVAARASAKSFTIAVFCCAKCVLYPNSRVVVASSTMKQAKLIVSEKIKTELMKNSPNLCREIEKIIDSQNDTKVIFRNGSTLVVVAADERSRGYRSTCEIYEEFRMIPKNIIDSVLSPFLMVRPADYLKNPEYSHLGEEPIEIFISSSWLKSHWMRKLVMDFMTDFYKNGNSCALFMDYSITLKHNIRTRNQLIKERKKLDPISWRIEYENECLSENTKAYFTYQMCSDNQVNKKAFYPRKDEDVRNHKKNPHVVPKQPNEIRILSCDMAFVNKTANDNSAFSVIRLLPETIDYSTNNDTDDTISIQQGYRRIVTYLEKNKGGDVDRQAIRIKQLFYDMDCDYCVLDGRNGGILCYDRLAKVLWDDNRNVEYPAWSCINDQNIADRIKVPGAIECVYVINATQKLNSDIAQSFRDVLTTHRIDLLVNLSDVIDDLQEKIPEYSSAADADTIVFYERPYLETQAFINETINLEYELGEQTGVIKISEVGSNTKDLYTSVSYGSYFAGLLEQDLLSQSSDYDYEVLIN